VIDQVPLFGAGEGAYGDESDFWATPPHASRAIESVLWNACADRGRWQTLEPSAGEGALLDLALSVQPRCVATCEIDPRRHAALAEQWAHITTPVLADFLGLDVEQTWPGLTTDPEHPLLIVTNPPWTKPYETIGLDFIEKCLRLAEPSRGIVCALLQLDWCTGDRWSKLHEKHACSLYPLRTRPKFNGSGTGMRPAAWFLWELGKPRREWRVVG